MPDGEDEKTTGFLTSVYLLLQQIEERVGYPVTMSLELVPVRSTLKVRYTAYNFQSHLSYSWEQCFLIRPDDDSDLENQAFAHECRIAIEMLVRGMAEEVHPPTATKEN